MLVVVDEFTRECLTIRVARKLSSWEVIEALADLFLSRGLPTYIRSDNGPEFTAKAVREWLGRLEVAPLFIEPGSPWENGYVESFNARLRDEFLDGEIFYTLKEVQVLTERWRWQYNHVRPHQALGYRPPGARGARLAASGQSGGHTSGHLLTFRLVQTTEADHGCTSRALIFMSRSSR